MMLDYKEMVGLAAKYSFPLSNHVIMNSKDQKIALNYPLVAKVVSKKIIHKTEAGCVKLGIKNYPELQAAFDSIMKTSGAEAVLVQEMECGLEVFVGAKRDPQFGIVIMFGLGGIYVEIFKDVSMRIAPIKEKDVLEMIDEVKVSKILKGARGKRYDTNSLAKLILLVSKLMEKEEQINELDLNPVFITDKSVKVADLRMI